MRLSFSYFFEILLRLNPHGFEAGAYFTNTHFPVAGWDYDWAVIPLSFIGKMAAFCLVLNVAVLPYKSFKLFPRNWGNVRHVLGWYANRFFGSLYNFGRSQVGVTMNFLLLPAQFLEGFFERPHFNTGFNPKINSFAEICLRFLDSFTRGCYFQGRSVRQYIFSFLDKLNRNLHLIFMGFIHALSIRDLTLIIQ